MIDVMGAAPFLVFAAVLVIVLLVGFAASRYRVANANEALIVAGSKGAKVRDASGKLMSVGGDQGIRVVVGGGTIVWPLRNKVGRLELTARQIKVVLPDAITCQGIKVQVEGVATFKIGRDVESIRNAAERFLGTNVAQIDDIVKNVLEGSLRSIVGTLTIEELIMDREKLLQRVQENAKLDLATTGIEIDSFTIQSIEDASGYIEQLGLQKLAPVTRDAKIAQAMADQEAAVKQAEAEQIKINASRDVALRQAEAQQMTAAAKAKAEQAEPLARAEAQQEVVRKQTELALLEAERREKELLAATIKPAEADAQAAVRRAEGDKTARIAIAEADARRAQLAGEAEARVVLTKGKAEAEALALRAEAYQQFNEAAILQTILEKLPAVVRAAAEPMASIDSLTVLSTDGASDIVRTTTDTVAQANATVKSLTGIDIAALVGAAVAADSSGRHKLAKRLVERLGDDLEVADIATDGHDGNGASGNGGSGGNGGTVEPRPGGGAGTAVLSAPIVASAPAAAPPTAPPATASPAPTPQAPAPPAPTAPNQVSATPAPPHDPAPRAATNRARPRNAEGLADAAAETAAALRRAFDGAGASPQASASDRVLHDLAVRIAGVPGLNLPLVRDLRLDDIGWRASGTLQEIWSHYAASVPDAYRGMTVGDLLDRYTK